MCSKRGSSPKVKPNFQQHQASKNYGTIHNIDTYLSGKLMQPIEDLFKFQDDTPSDIEIIIASSRVRSRPEKSSQCSLSSHGASGPLQNIPTVPELEHEREQTKSDEKKKPAKSSWEFGDRYSQKTKPGPDFGPPIITSSHSKSMKCLAGGPTPINRLKKNDGESDAPKISRSNTSRLSPNAKESRIGRENQLFKRRKHEVTNSKRSIIDLEGVPKRKNSRNTDQLLSAKSGIPQNKSLNHPVPELWKLDEFMRIKKRSRYKHGMHSSEVRPVNTSKNKNSFLELTPEKKSTSRSHEDPADPIDDESGDGEVDFVPSIPSNSKITETAPDPSESTGSEVSRLQSKLSGSHPASSRYFLKEDNQTRSSNSKSQYDSTADLKSSTPSKWSDETHRTKVSTKNLAQLFNPDESLDEISIAHYDESHKKLRFLKRDTEKIVKSSYGKSIGMDHLRSVNKGDSSLTTGFSSSKVSKQKFDSVDEIFSVLQVFCKSKQWLLLPTQAKSTDQNKEWTLHLDQKKKFLTIFDENNRLVPGLDLGRVNSIQKSTTNGKMIISRPLSTRDAIGAQMICLELKDLDESQCFLEKLKKYDPNVEINFSTELRHVEKVFEHTLKTARYSAARTKVEKTPSLSPSIQEAEDLKLIKAKLSKRKNDDSSKTLAYASSPTGPKGIAKLMTTRSQRNITDDESESVAKNVISHSSKALDEVGDTSEHYFSSRLSRSRSRRDLSANNHVSRSTTPRLEKWTVSNPAWTKKWNKSIVFPIKGKNKATVDRADIDRLDEGEFINDNLMMFYLRWLQYKTEKKFPGIAKRVYFQNTFFYERLTKSTKGKTGINYENVERWTSKVNLFEFDYIIVPVNENFHWYVAIICNAPKLLEKPQSPKLLEKPQSPKLLEKPQSPNTFSEISKNDKRPNVDNQKTTDANNCSKSSTGQLQRQSMGVEINIKIDKMTLDDQIEKNWDSESDPVLLENSDPELSQIVNLEKHEKKKLQLVHKMPRKHSVSEPRIITLDSFGNSHSLTCTNLKRYLLREIESKLKRTVDDPGNLGRTAKNIPQQDNFSDCGLFVLGYVEIFLKDPDAFISDLLQNKFPDTVCWPKPSEMRAKIRTLLFKLQTENLESPENSEEEKDEEDITAKTQKTKDDDISSLSQEHQNVNDFSLDLNHESESQETHQSLITDHSQCLDKLNNTSNQSGQEDTANCTSETETDFVMKKESPAHDNETSSKKIFGGVNKFEPKDWFFDRKSHFQSSDSSPCLKLELKLKKKTDDDISFGSPQPSPPTLTQLKSAEKKQTQDTWQNNQAKRDHYSKSSSVKVNPHRVLAKIRHKPLDVFLSKDSTPAHKEINKTHHDTLKHYINDKSPNHTSPLEKKPQILHSSSLSSIPILNSKSISSDEDDTFLPKASEIHRSSSPASVKSHKKRENFQYEIGENVKRKRKRGDGESDHRKRTKLSASSWQRDGIEKALLKNISKSSIDGPDKRTCSPCVEESSVILIE